MVWVALLSMVQLLVQPLVRSATAESSIAYAEWLLDRGASRSHATLEAALEDAAGSRHRSVESFVREFVRIISEEGTLPLALDVFSASHTTDVFSAEDLIAQILADLSGLTPQDPIAHTRIGKSESGAVALGSRSFQAETHSYAGYDGAVSQQSPGDSPVRPAAGLHTSIQALGP